MQDNPEEMYWKLTCELTTILHSATLLGSKSLHPTRLDHVNSPSMLPHLHGFSLAEMHEMYRSEITASVILFKYSRHHSRAARSSIRKDCCDFSSTFLMCRKHMSQWGWQTRLHMLRWHIESEEMKQWVAKQYAPLMSMNIPPNSSPCHHHRCNSNIGSCCSLR